MRDVRDEKINLMNGTLVINVYRRFVEWNRN